MPIADSIIIKMDDSDKRDLTISADNRELGSQYDSFAKSLVFQRPKGWENDALILFFKDSKTAYEPLDIGVSNTFPVPDSLTQDTRLTMQTAFRSGDGLTHSDLIEFTLRPSMQQGRAPAAPWPKPVDELVADAYVSVTYRDNLLSFYNMSGETVGSVTVEGGGGNVAVSEEEPENPSEGLVWAQIVKGAAGTSTLSSLALGTEVMTGFDYLGEPIVFNVAAKNYAGYPSGSVTLFVRDPVVSRCLDAKEPGNPTGDRATNGNNRYSLSNLRQWLNSEAPSGQWHSPSHQYDAPPLVENMYQSRCPYADDAGFLSYFPGSFRELLMPTTISVTASSTDDSAADTMTDRVWLASAAELTAWGYTGNKLIKYGTQGLVNNFSGGGKTPVFGNPCAWYVRNPYTDASGIRIYNSTASYSYSLSNASEGIAFVINLPSDTPVALENGKYVIQAGTVSGRTKAYWDGLWVPVDGSERIERLEQGISAAGAGRYNGATINFLGDSITEAAALSKPYTRWMAELLEAAGFRNYGVSGSAVARRSGRTDSMLERYAAMADADLVCLLGGVNDCWSGVPLGTLGNGDEYTFAGAAESLIKGLVTKYPQKRVLVFAPAQAEVTNSALLSQYVDMLRQVCAKYSVPMLDTYARLGRLFAAFTLSS